MAVLYDLSGHVLAEHTTAAGKWELPGLVPHHHYAILVTAEDDKGLTQASNKLYFQTPDNAIRWPHPDLQVSVLNDQARLTWQAATPPTVHQGQTLIYYDVVITGTQTGKVYYQAHQLPTAAQISGFKGNDEAIHVNITATDSLQDTPVKISEDVPVGLQHKHV
jgi:hypothetical protein